MAATSTPRLRRLLPPDSRTRWLATATLVNTFGNGLFLAISALYFTRVVGLSPTEVGAGLTAGGICGMLAGLPLGHLADRHGARAILVVLMCLAGFGVLAYTRVRSLPAFVVTACVVTFADRGGSAIRNGLIAVILPRESRLRGRAYVRVVSNVGIGLGSAASAIALRADTPGAYLVAIAVDAFTFFISALLFMRIVTAAPSQPSPSARWASLAAPLRDLPYLTVTLVNGVLMVQSAVLEVGLPLWVVQQTRAPRTVVAAVLLLNTVLVVCLQMSLTRTSPTAGPAAAACRRGGLTLAVMCLIAGTAHGRPPAVATGVIIAAVVAMTYGEMLVSAGSWTLSYDLAPPASPHAYQGLFNSGATAGRMLGPLLVTTTALSHGLIGWIVLGCVFAAAGIAAPPVTRWAERDRPTLTARSRKENSSAA